jgi:TPR repeat protein
LGEIAGDYFFYTRYSKLAADQAHAHAQFNCGICLHNGRGVDIDYAGVAHYYKLAADQGDTQVQFSYDCCLLVCVAVQCHIPKAFSYLKTSADNEKSISQLFFEFFGN